ncbi:zinc knuckle-domain-containing protein [Biscogniauxia mediterranea]|nr:zinc knuckle-domain-containing protein [Biscogniauxia mediterranea]
MYRRGPSKVTPANVQCQKCLKRGHYSYECKTSAQERPYVARPSRTQQLLNPKLVPKLTNDVPEALQKKKGVADELLAKREAERAKKRDLERDEDDRDEELPKRRRSASFESGSTVSTGRSRSPPRPQESPSRSPPARTSRSYRSPSPVGRAPRRRSFDSASDDHSRRDSLSPPRRGGRDTSHERPSRRTASPSPSPPPARRDMSPAHSSGYSARDRSPDRRSAYSHRGRHSPSQSPPPETRRGFRSRSPQQHRRRGRSPPRHDDSRAGRPARPPRAGNDRGPRGGPRGGPPRQDGRECSLSPFSKRLALTQAMNMGR